MPKRKIKFTDPYDLHRAYKRLNKRYFGGKLPAPETFELEWSERMPSACMAVCHVHDVSACDEWCPEPCWGHVIRIDPVFKRFESIWEMHLLHEMCHLRACLGDKRFASHGPTWQAEMMRLAKAGAFNDLW
jgi:hypothetical protein